MLRALTVMKLEVSLYRCLSCYCIRHFHLALSAYHEDEPFLSLCRPYCRAGNDFCQRACFGGKQKTAAATGESEYRTGAAVATSYRNWAVNGGKKPEKGQNVPPVPKGGRSAPG